MAQTEFDRQAEVTRLLLEGISSTHVSQRLSRVSLWFHSNTQWRQDNHKSCSSLCFVNICMEYSAVHGFFFFHIFPSTTDGFYVGYDADVLETEMFTVLFLI